MKSVGQVIGSNISMTLIDEGTCEDCGHETKTYEIPIVGGPHKGEMDQFVYGCRCEDYKLANEAREAKKRNDRAKIRDSFDRYSLINKKLQRLTLDDYEPENKTQNFAKRTTKRYIDVFNPESPRTLLFCGGYGVGKSHLAKCITDGVIEKGYSAIFISLPKLMRKLRSSYGKKSEITEDEIYHMLETVDLLVLDDLGVEKNTDWSEERIYDVIDSRQGMNTIYTTNYSPDDLKNLLGERDASRIMAEDETTIIEIEGKNHRYSKEDNDEQSGKKTNEPE